MEVWTTIILPIISGLVACVPLVVKIVDISKKAVKEKNWTVVMQIMLQLMSEAEQNYATGAERKEYVLDSIKSLQGSLNYEVDLDAIEVMIDSIVKASKSININKK